VICFQCKRPGPSHIRSSCPSLRNKPRFTNMGPGHPSVENHDEVAKTISYLSSTLNEGLDCLVEPLNSIDYENLLFEIDSNNDSEDLLNW
jgi:hypothetical protein